MPGETLSLFEEPDYERTPLGLKLAALSDRGVYIGTSSWKYPGWLGQIYTEDHYKVRGQFSEKRFQANCLAEYAASFPSSAEISLSTSSLPSNTGSACSAPPLPRSEIRFQNP